MEVPQVRSGPAHPLCTGLGGGDGAPGYRCRCQAERGQQQGGTGHIAHSRGHPALHTREDTSTGAHPSPGACLRQSGDIRALRPSLPTAIATRTPAHRKPGDTGAERTPGHGDSSAHPGPSCAFPPTSFHNVFTPTHAISQNIHPPARCTHTCVHSGPW